MSKKGTKVEKINPLDSTFTGEVFKTAREVGLDINVSSSGFVTLTVDEISTLFEIAVSKISEQFEAYSQAASSLSIKGLKDKKADTKPAQFLRLVGQVEGNVEERSSCCNFLDNLSAEIGQQTLKLAPLAVVDQATTTQSTPQTEA